MDQFISYRIYTLTLSISPEMVVASDTNKEPRRPLSRKNGEANLELGQRLIKGAQMLDNGHQIGKCLAGSSYRFHHHILA